MYCSCLCRLLNQRRKGGWDAWMASEDKAHVDETIFVNMKSVYLHLRDLHLAQPRLFSNSPLVPLHCCKFRETHLLE